MPRVTVRLRGKEEIARTLSKLPEHFQKAASRYNRRTGNEVAADAIRRMNEQAVDTGRGKTAIRMVVYQDGLTVEVVADFDYAAFIEYGTGPRGQQTNTAPTPPGWRYHSGNGGMPPLEIIRRWCTRHGIDPNNAFVIARSIARNGLPARPFMHPSWMVVEQNYVRNMSRIIQAAMQELRT